MKPLFAVCAVALLTLNRWAGDGAGTARSPDQIVFVSTRQGGQEDIYLMNDDGTQVTNLTNHAGILTLAVWAGDGAGTARSPDQIVFVSTRQGGQEDIYLMNDDGTQVTNLTNHAGRRRSRSTPTATATPRSTS